MTWHNSYSKDPAKGSIIVPNSTIYWGPTCQTLEPIGTFVIMTPTGIRVTAGKNNAHRGLIESYLSLEKLGYILNLMTHCVNGETLPCKATCWSSQDIKEEWLWGWEQFLFLWTLTGRYSALSPLERETEHPPQPQPKQAESFSLRISNGSSWMSNILASCHHFT